MIAHFIKSTVFEVFYLLTKDNVVIDKLVAYGNGVDMVQDLSYVFYKTVPWQNYKFQLICSLLTLNVKNIYLSALALVFVLSFVMSFGFLCYQVQTSGTIYTSTLLKATRYQYGLLSTFLFFPTIEQLINTVSIESTTWLLISLICIVIFLLYASIVCLGSFLLFSPNPDPRIHSSRNSQLVDAFEIISKIFVAVGFGFLDPKTACFIQFIVRLSLYTASVITPSFYNHKSNVIRSGVFLGLLVGSIASIIVCYVQVSFYVCYILLGVVFLLSAIGMAFFHFYQNLITLPSPLFYFAAKVIAKNYSKKDKIQLKNTSEEWLCSFLSPVQIVQAIRSLSNIQTKQQKSNYVRLIIREGNNHLEEDDEAEDMEIKKKKIQTEQDIFERILLTNFDEISRLLILQLFTCGLQRFPDSIWLKAQYLIILENLHHLYPTLTPIPKINQFSDEVMNEAFIKEKTLDVHYILFHFYKKRLFEKADKSKSQLKNVVDIVAYSHDKDKFIQYVLDVVMSIRQFIQILEREVIDINLLVSFASDMQIKWNKSKNYLKKSLSRVPNASDLLLLYKESCRIFDNNLSLIKYLNSVMNTHSSSEAIENFDMAQFSEVMIEKQKNTLFHTPNHLSPAVGKIYKVSELYYKIQYILSFSVFMVFFYLIMVQVNFNLEYNVSGNLKVLQYGLDTQTFYCNKFSFELYDQQDYFSNCSLNSEVLKKTWRSVIADTTFRAQEPSPFQLKVTNLDKEMSSLKSFEESNYILQWHIDHYLIDTGTFYTLDSNMPNVLDGFFNFFLSTREYSDHFIKTIQFDILYTCGIVYSVLFGVMIPISYYIATAIYKDMY